MKKKGVDYSTPENKIRKTFNRYRFDRQIKYSKIILVCQQKGSDISTTPRLKK